MTNEMSREEQIAYYHVDILTLLKADPHHPLAQVLGQGLMDLLSD